MIPRASTTTTVAARAAMVVPLLALAGLAYATQAAPEGDQAAAAKAEAMVELAWRSGCFNCHDLDTTVRGPAWRAVAARYRGEPEAFDRLLVKVIEGGGGAWGDDVMSPNRRVPEEDVRALLTWLLTLESANGESQ